jgi:hypothetical protein
MGNQAFHCLKRSVQDILEAKIVYGTHHPTSDLALMGNPNILQKLFETGSEELA